MDEKTLRLWLKIGGAVLVLTLVGAFTAVIRAALTAH
jgi:hypothetical protein